MTYSSHLFIYVYIHILDIFYLFLSSHYSLRSGSVEPHSIPGQEAPRPGPNSGDRCRHVSERKITMYATVLLTNWSPVFQFMSWPWYTQAGLLFLQTSFFFFLNLHVNWYLVSGIQVSHFMNYTLYMPDNFFIILVWFFFSCRHTCFVQYIALHNVETVKINKFQISWILHLDFLDLSSVSQELARFWILPIFRFLVLWMLNSAQLLRKVMKIIML